MRSTTKAKIGKGPAFLDFIRALPCRVCCGLEWPLPLIAYPDCSSYALGQTSPTEAHHTSNAGMSQKSPDREAIPLCGECHREGRSAAHKFGKHFWDFHGIDKAKLITELNVAYERRMK